MDGVFLTMSVTDANVFIQGSGLIGDGSKAVTTAGTRVQLAASTLCNRVIISAKASNSDVIVVGSTTVVAADGTRRGVALFPGNSLDIHVNNLSLVWLDAVSSGDAVSFIYFV